MVKALLQGMLSTLPQGLFQKISYRDQVAGGVDFNLSEALKTAAEAGARAHAADADCSSAGDHTGQQTNSQQQHAEATTVQLSHDELSVIIDIIFNPKLSPHMLATWEQGQQTHHQPTHDTQAANAGATAAAGTDAGVGGLPFRSLDLSEQNLHLSGWHQLLQCLAKGQYCCLQRLVVRNCGIAAAGAGDCQGGNKG